MNKHGGPRKGLTYEERCVIQQYLKKVGFKVGYLKELIKITGRSKSCIHRELKENGREKYNAQNAQKKSEEIKKRRIEKITGKNSFGRRSKNISERLENLEMQVEILSETIEEIVKNGS